MIYRFVNSSEVYKLVFYLNIVLRHCHSWLARQYLGRNSSTSIPRATHVNAKPYHKLYLEKRVWEHEKFENANSIVSRYFIGSVLTLVCSVCWDPRVPFLSTLLLAQSTCSFHRQPITTRSTSYGSHVPSLVVPLNFTLALI